MNQVFILPEKIDTDISNLSNFEHENNITQCINGRNTINHSNKLRTIDQKQKCSGICTYT